jgi:hypothetical protein
MVFGLNHFVHLGLIDKYHKALSIFLRISLIVSPFPTLWVIVFLGIKPFP